MLTGIPHTFKLRILSSAHCCGCSEHILGDAMSSLFMTAETSGRWWEEKRREICRGKA